MNKGTLTVVFHSVYAPAYPEGIVASMVTSWVHQVNEGKDLEVQTSTENVLDEVRAAVVEGILHHDNLRLRFAEENVVVLVDEQANMSGRPGDVYVYAEDRLRRLIQW